MYASRAISSDSNFSGYHASISSVMPLNVFPARGLRRVASVATGMIRRTIVFSVPHLKGAPPLPFISLVVVAGLMKNRAAFYSYRGPWLAYAIPIIFPWMTGRTRMTPVSSRPLP